MIAAIGGGPRIFDIGLMPGHVAVDDGEVGVWKISASRATGIDRVINGLVLAIAIGFLTVTRD
jgi:hypothetical protein